MEYIILDTNIFFNMQSGLGLGSTTKEILTTLTHYAHEGKHVFSFVFSPHIVDELLSFFDKEEDRAQCQLFLAYCKTLTPALHELSVPAAVLAAFITDTRQRNLNGLKVAESVVLDTAKTFMGNEQLDHIAFQKTCAPFVASLRERYRNATRTGIVDSVGDLESLFLAKQFNGILVTSDEGLQKWARVMGVAEVHASLFRSYLDRLLA